MEMTKMGFNPVTDYLNHTEIPVGTKKSDKTIILSASLLMRLMEFAKEDAKDDVALHQVLENIMAFSDGTNPLTIAEYDNIVADATGSSLSKDEEYDSDSEDDEANYDLPMDNGETKVNGNLVDELENAVASYHEGGISGNDCYDAIQRAFANNKQCHNCEMDKVLNNIEVLPTSEYQIDTDNGSVCDGECTIAEEEPSGFEAEIANIINAGRF